MTFWQVYGYIIAEFLFEYFVYAALFLHKLGRRRYFYFRAVPAVVALFALGLPVALFYKAFGTTLWGRILVYSILFALFTLLAWICFDESYLTVLFCCSMAYAAQNLAYKIYLIIWTAGEQLRLYDNWGNKFDLYYRLIYYSVFAVCAVVFWFVFIRRITAKLENRKLNYRMLVITVLVLGITVLL